VKITYDKKYDVLYIVISEEPAIAKESENGLILLRFSIDEPDKLVGITIFDFKKYNTEI
jgi:uncharacterized protein YuzE